MPTFSTVNHALQFGSNNPTVSIYGTDISGYISYQMSGSFLQFAPGTKYFALRIIFGVPYGSPPVSVTLTPANSFTEQILASQLAIGFYVDGGIQPGDITSDIQTTHFDISGTSTTDTILGASELAWYYEVSTGIAGGGGGGGGTVTSVATDSTLSGGPIIVSGTLGINLANANTWSAKQTFTNHIAVDGYTIDLSSGATTSQVLQYNGTSFIAATQAGAVSSVSNSNGSLTISPTTGAVIASLNLAHANTWSATQTFSNHIIVDGYTVDLSGGATSNQILQYNGTKFLPATILTGIGGSITNQQVAFGNSTANTIQGSSVFTFDGTNFKAPNILCGHSSNYFDVDSANFNLNFGTQNAQTIVMGGGTYSNGVQIKTFLDMQSHLINNVTDPSSPQDAATKNYVDTHSGSTFAASYNSGSSAADQTALIQASKGGPIVIKGNSAGLGSLFTMKASDNTVLMNMTDNGQHTFLSYNASTAQFVFNSQVMPNGGYWAFGNSNNGYDVMRLTHETSSLPINTVFGARIKFGDGTSSGTLQAATGLYLVNLQQGDSATSTGTVIDTAFGWSNSGTRLLSIRTGSSGVGGIGASERFGFCGDGGMQVRGGTAAVSDSSTGRIRFNSGTNHFEISENGGSYSQVLAGSVPTVYEVNFHTADWAKNAAQAGVPGSAYTCAVWFNLAKAGHITGARWYQPTGMTTNVTVKLWDDGDNLLKTVTITPTAGAINTASFATSYAHTPSNVRLYLSVYDGVNAILMNSSPNKPGSYASGASTVVGGLWGPELWQHGHGFSPGDVSPSTADDRFIGIEPLYTIP